MRTKGLLALVTAGVALALVRVDPGGVTAQDAVALSGLVSSEQEGNMEGVVVSARRDGTTFSVSVVSDAAGRYSFPRTHVQPGSYAVAIRAVGYDLAGPATVDVGTGAAASLDLRLVTTKDLPTQLSSLEWINSMPGTQREKDNFAYQAVSCGYCHSYGKVTQSKYSAEQFVPVITRMQQFYPDGTSASRDGRGRGQRAMPSGVENATKNPDWGIRPGIPKKELAAFLATVNLSGGKRTWSYELKPLPRPTGKSTRVIITQWDFPRSDTVAHDITVDLQGNLWYSDESRMFIGKLDPRSNTITEYPLLPVPAGDLPGARDLQADRDGNIWFPMRRAGGGTILTKFDPRTQQISVVEGAGGQFMALGPDGKIWAGWKRIDPKTQVIETTVSWNRAPNLPPGPHGAYADLVELDSRGNPWTTDFAGSYLIGVDVRTGEATFVPTPTRDSMPRRGRIAQDRFWFAEYTGDRIGMLDIVTLNVQEWELDKYTQPYTVSTPDRLGRVYASSNMSERVLRLDPRTGEVLQYQIPTDFDSKKIEHDPATDRPVVYMANTRSARLVRIEPLD